MTVVLSEDYMPTINLNRPAIDAGQISAADLEAARQHSTDRVLHLCRVHIAGRDTCSGQCETGAGCDCTPLQPAGLDYQGRHETRRFGQQAEFVDTIATDYSTLDDCAPEGGKHAEPAPSAQKKRDVNGARIGFVLLLLSATTVVGVIVGAIYARRPIAWPLG